MATTQASKKQPQPSLSINTRQRRPPPVMAARSPGYGQRGSWTGTPTNFGPGFMMAHPGTPLGMGASPNGIMMPGTPLGAHLMTPHMRPPTPKSVVVKRGFGSKIKSVFSRSSKSSEGGAASTAKKTGASSAQQPSQPSNQRLQHYGSTTRQAFAGNPAVTATSLSRPSSRPSTDGELRSRGPPVFQVLFSPLAVNGAQVLCSPSSGAISFRQGSAFPPAM
mmetsp:Transcript_32095/g.73569  ORF Transcript_32095/g.73569 Transcript_32095/m.73569 type:complete len:221 (-) Transcript_32095:199-861(-)